MAFLHEPMTAGEIILGMAALFILLFIPGLLLTLAIFPKRKDLDIVERIAFSFIFGLTPIFLIYFGDKNFNLAINAVTALILWMLVCVIGGGVWFLRTKTEFKLNVPSMPQVASEKVKKKGGAEETGKKKPRRRKKK